MCAAAAAAGGVSEHVGEITSVKGGSVRRGKHVEDCFTIKTAKLVELLVGQYNKIGKGALVVRAINKTAVMLAAPLDFSYRTTRVDEGEDQKEELYVTGHFIMLVPRTRGVPRWVFDEERAEYTEKNKHVYKIALAKACNALGQDKFSRRVSEFLVRLQ